MRLWKKKGGRVPVGAELHFLVRKETKAWVSRRGTSMSWTMLRLERRGLGPFWLVGGAIRPLGAMTDRPKGSLAVCGPNGVWSRGRIRGNSRPWSVPPGVAERGAAERIPVGELSRSGRITRQEVVSSRLKLSHFHKVRPSLNDSLSEAGLGLWEAGRGTAALRRPRPLETRGGFRGLPLRVGVKGPAASAPAAPADVWLAADDEQEEEGGDVGDLGLMVLLEFVASSMNARYMSTSTVITEGGLTTIRRIRQTAVRQSPVAPDLSPIENVWDQIGWPLRAAATMAHLEGQFVPAMAGSFSRAHPTSGATVVERLACSPSAKANRIQSPAGSLRDFACRNRAGRCRWSAGFLGDLTFPPPFHSGAASFAYQSPPSALKTSIYELVAFPKVGWRNEEGAWLHLLGDVVKGSIDLGLEEIVVTEEMARDIAFSMPCCAPTQRYDGNTARLARRSDVLVSPVSLPRILTLDARLHPTLNSEVLRADGYEASAGMVVGYGEGEGMGEGRSPRKPADQQHHPARFPCGSPGATQPGIERGSPRWEASNLTARPPRPRRVLYAPEKNGVAGQENIETPFANQRVVTYSSACSPSNSEHFAACSSQSDTRPVPISSFSQSENGFPYNSRGRGDEVVSIIASHQGQPGSIPGRVARIFACGNSAGRRHRPAGFLWDLPSPTRTLHSDRAPYSLRSILIGKIGHALCCRTLDLSNQHSALRHPATIFGEVDVGRKSGMVAIPTMDTFQDSVTQCFANKIGTVAIQNFSAQGVITCFQAGTRRCPSSLDAARNETPGLNGAEMRERGKRQRSEKTRRQEASPSTIPACENPGANPPGIEPGTPWWEASALATEPPRPLSIICEQPIYLGAPDFRTSCCVPKYFRAEPLRKKVYLRRPDSGALRDIFLEPFGPRLLGGVFVTALALGVAAALVNAAVETRGGARWGFSDSLVWSVGLLCMQGTVREFNDLLARLHSPVYTRDSHVCSLAPDPHSSQCYFTPSSMALATRFPCKSAIGSELSRACLMNCEPIGEGKWEITEKTRRQEASSGTIPTCKSPGVARAGIESGSSWWEVSGLTAQQLRPQQEYMCFQICQNTPLQHSRAHIKNHGSWIGVDCGRGLLRIGIDGRIGIDRRIVSPRWCSSQTTLLSPRRTGFDSRAGSPEFSHVGDMADVTASRQVFSEHTRFPIPCIPPLLLQLASPSLASTDQNISIPTPCIKPPEGNKCCLSAAGSPWNPRTPSGSVLLFFSLLFALVMYNAYAAFVTSVLSVRAAPIRGLHDLLARNFAFGYVLGGQDDNFLRTVNDTTLRQLYFRGLVRAQGVHEPAEGLARASRGGYAFFTSSRAARRALGAVPHELRCDMQALRVPAAAGVVALPLSSAAPAIRKLVDLSLLRMREVGALRRLQESAAAAMPLCSASSSFNSAQLSDVYSAFLLLSGGLVLGLGLAVVEALWNRRQVLAQGLAAASRHRRRLHTATQVPEDAAPPVQFYN
ncbi:hypothetical protein PR048_006830 [Dryococelus australis]|uniref:Ionotropic glutamate receptor C-terminal domain-containing protein n=1 Tax=Dryococelus australis TaxID=614101 RepID=A0ABQ9IE89_9NEOP|nr:hypothetical protein PR048_006830 [Dryococelus australis]